MSNLTDDYEIIFKTANDLLETEKINSKQFNLRLMGVRMSALQESSKAAKQNDIKAFLTNMKKKAVKRDGEKPKEIKVKKRASNNLKDMFARIKQTRRSLSDHESDSDDIEVVFEKK